MSFTTEVLQERLAEREAEIAELKEEVERLTQYAEGLELAICGGHGVAKNLDRNPQPQIDVSPIGGREGPQSAT